MRRKRCVQSPSISQLHAERSRVEPAVLAPPLTANKQRRARRTKAIADWWQVLWATGETFHLKIERPRLFLHFQTAEAQRLNGQAAECDPMDGSTFVKLLKESINKTDGEAQRRPEGGGDPRVWWEIDAATHCPDELKQTWQSEKVRRHQARVEAQRQRHAREEAARAEQRVRDEQLAAEAEARQKEEDRMREADHTQRMATMRLYDDEESRRLPIWNDEVSEDDEDEDEEWDDGDDDGYHED